MRANSILHYGIIGAMICGTAHAVSDATLIRQLVNEKNQKLARLEQCTKKMTGFKVAGISTLGLTAVGVVGDIALVNKNKEMDGQITFAKNELARQQEKLNKAQTETADLHKTIEERKAECETHADIAKWNGKKCVCRDEKKFYNDGKCLVKSPKRTDCKSITDLDDFADLQKEITQIVINSVLEEQNKVSPSTICDYNNFDKSIPILLDYQYQTDMSNAVETTCKNASGTFVRFTQTSDEIKQDAINQCTNGWKNFDKLNMCESALEICEIVATNMPRIRAIGCKCE